MKSSIIVTGVNGFVGQHLAKNLHEHGNSVIGIGLDKSAEPSLTGILDDYISCDLTSKYAVRQLENQLMRATAIINLAGIATTSNDLEMTNRILSINTAVHEVLHQTLKSIGSHIRIIAVSTGLAYQSNQPMPLHELSLLQPDEDSTNAYVRSKLRVEKNVEKYRNSKMDIIVVRPFNHTGPGQGLGFFVPDQIAKITEAKREAAHLSLGDSFDFWRDFTDVRDVVDAYRLLATLPRERLSKTVYNISSGVPVFGRDLFRIIASSLHFNNYDLTARKDSSSPKLFGSHDLLTKDTGWRPNISLQKTIQDQI